jgi:selenocysteine lyase/cysteine desulfurase
VTFNFYDRDGHSIDHRLVEEHASAANAVRVSIGLVTDAADVNAFIALARLFLA